MMPTLMWRNPHCAPTHTQHQSNADQSRKKTNFHRHLHSSSEVQVDASGNWNCCWVCGEMAIPSRCSQLCSCSLLPSASRFLERLLLFIFDRSCPMRCISASFSFFFFALPCQLFHYTVSCCERRCLHWTWVRSTNISVPSVISTKSVPPEHFCSTCNLDETLIDQHVHLGLTLKVMQRQI